MRTGVAPGLRRHALRVAGSLGIPAGARALAAVLGLAATSLLAAALGADGLGVFALALAVQGWVQHLGEMGLRSAVTAQAADGTACRRLLIPYLALRLASTGAVAAIAVALVAWLFPPAWPVVALVLLSLLGLSLHFDWIALVEGRPWHAALPLVLRPAVMLAGLALLSAPVTPTAAAVLFAASWLAAAMVTWTHLPRAVVDRDTPALARGLARQGPPLAVNTLLNHALVGLDLLLVAQLAGVATAGRYHLAAQLATALLVVANAAGQQRLAQAGPAPGGTAPLTVLFWLGCGLGALLLATAPATIAAVLGADLAIPAVLLAPFAAWIALQHVSAPLQALAIRRDRRVLLLTGASVALLATLTTLAGAALFGSVILAAWSRPLAELARVAVLLGALDAAERRHAVAQAIVPAAGLAIVGVLATSL